MKIQPNQQPPKQINNQTYKHFSTKPTNQPTKQANNQSSSSSMSGFGIWGGGPLELDTISSHMNDRLLYGQNSPIHKIAGLVPDQMFTWSRVYTFIPPGCILASKVLTSIHDSHKIWLKYWLSWKPDQTLTLEQPKKLAWVQIAES